MGFSHSRYDARAYSDASIEDDFSYGKRAYTLDVQHVVQKSAEAYNSAETTSEKIKALDPTGLTSLPEVAEKAYNGDKRAQGQLIGSVILLKSASPKGKVSKKGPSDSNSMRARHHTDTKGSKGIMKDKAINPSRPAQGNPIGVDVEVAPYGKTKTASSETVALGSGKYIEFDIKPGEVKPTPMLGVC